MIQNIGCNSDGGIWFSLLIEVDNEQQIGVLPMSQEAGQRFHKAIGKALKQGAKWKKTGIRPASAPKKPQVEENEASTRFK